MERGEGESRPDAATVEPAPGRTGEVPPTSWIQVGYVLTVIALASGLAEAGVQHGSVFGPRKTAMGVEVFYDDLVRLLLNGRGNAWVNADGGGHRLLPVWWAFLILAAAGAVLVKTPLLLAPVWFGGRWVAQRTSHYPLVLAYLAAIVVGATIGVSVLYIYNTVRIGHLSWRVWGIPYLPGFGGCLAGGACGALVLTGLARRRGLSSWLVEIALIDLMILGTAWLIRCR